MIVETFLFEIDFFVSCPFFGLGLVDSFEGPLLGMLLLLVFFGRDFEPFFCFSRVDLEKVNWSCQFFHSSLRMTYELIFLEDVFLSEPEGGRAVRVWTGLSIDVRVSIGLGGRGSIDSRGEFSGVVSGGVSGKCPGGIEWLHVGKITGTADWLFTENEIDDSGHDESESSESGSNVNREFCA